MVAFSRTSVDLDVGRYARHIALPEIGAEGQARICAARVAVVGSDLTAETAAIYLRAAGVGRVFEASESMTEPWRTPIWRRTLSDFDLVIRSGFDDAPMDGVAAWLGLPVIFVRATSDAVDMVSFSGRVPSADAPVDVPVKAAAMPTTNNGAAVLAGTLAAAEALHAIIRESSGPITPRIRHLRLPLDGREPLVQEIGERP